MDVKIKTPPKSTIEKNIMQFVQKMDGATIEQIAEYLNLQQSITLTIMKSMQKRTYISMVDDVYHSNFFYHQMT